MFTFIAVHKEGLAAGVAPSASTAVPPPLNSMCACMCVRVHTRARTPHSTSRKSCSAMHAGPSARSILEPPPFKAQNPRAGARPVLAASAVPRPRGRSLFRPTKGQVKRAAASLAEAPGPRLWGQARHAAASLHPHPFTTYDGARRVPWSPSACGRGREGQGGLRGKAGRAGVSVSHLGGGKPEPFSKEPQRSVPKVTGRV